MSSTTEQVVSATAEEVATNLEEAAEAVRRVEPRLAKNAGYVLGGLVIGLGLGFVVGRRLMREKIKAELFKDSEEELKKIREYYAASRPETEKPSLEQIIEERGYSPETVEVVEEGRPLPPPVPIPSDQTLRVRRTPRTEEGEKDKNDGWSYPYELSKRNWKSPHVIHQDEYAGNETEYRQTSYTYYAGDDVLVDEDETVLPNRENLIGKEALQKFGHGTDDYNIVYVRNPPLELEIEIIRDQGKYAVEVQGLEEEDE